MSRAARTSAPSGGTVRRLFTASDSGTLSTPWPV